MIYGCSVKFVNPRAERILNWFTIHFKAYFVAANRALNFMSFGGAKSTFYVGGGGLVLPTHNPHSV